MTPDAAELLVPVATRASRALQFAAVLALVVCTMLLVAPRMPSAAIGDGGLSGISGAPRASGRLRVAVLLSGMPRCVDGRALAGWRAFLSGYDVDVYAHFWVTTGDACAAFARPGDLYATSNGGVDCFAAGVPDSFARAWSPFATIAASKFEPPLAESTLVTHEYPRTFQASTPYRTLSLYTSMLRAQLLLEAELVRNASLEYDWVIRGRTDLAFSAFPDLSLLERGYVYFEDEPPGGPAHPYDEWMRNEVFIVSGERSPPGTEGTRLRHFPPSGACAGCAAALHRIIETVDVNYLDGALMNDEHMMFAHVKRTGLLSRCRALPLNVLAVSVSRDCTTPDTATAPAVPYAPDVRSYTFKGFLYEGPPVAHPKPQAALMPEGGGPGV